MKYIKKFELFDNDNYIPSTSKNVLTNYYSCDDCDDLWSEFNNEPEICTNCGSSNIEELPEDEWYEVAKSRLSPAKLKKLESKRKKDKNQFVNLFNLKSNDDKDVN